ncbi:MAG: selenocysteine-specific translation elongation factor [Pyrinomonadaceae bacterium]
MDIIVGTAGHIDHGKTALVKALTGEDTDRLPEEIRRGITIELGFAEMVIDGVRIGFVDAPGHERFVKHMLAGASGIDLVLLVVAADEGVMPQTREHFDICRLLDTKKGLIVLTKCDLADDELLEMVRVDVAGMVKGSFLENAPVVTVSSKTSNGIEELRTAIYEAAGTVPNRSEETITRLAIDRRFSKKGFGTVVTGTLTSGEVHEADEMELLPAGIGVRVRGLQTHGLAVTAAHAGQRTAINLGGVDKNDVDRGMLLAEKGRLAATRMIDALVEVLGRDERPLRTRQRVRLHLGTAEILGRLQVLNESAAISAGETDLVQIRLESPIATIPGERFIIRSYSPQMTIAGGIVIDAFPVKHRRRDIDAVRKTLTGLQNAGCNTERLNRLVEMAGDEGLNLSDLRARTGWRDGILRSVLNENMAAGSIIEAGRRYISRASFEGLKARTIEAVAVYHRTEPLSPGISRETLRDNIFRFLPHDIFGSVITSLDAAGQTVSDREIVKLNSYNLQLSTDEVAIRDRIKRIYSEARLEVPKLTEVLAEVEKGWKLPSENVRKIFHLLINDAELVKVSDEFYFSQSVIDGLAEKLRNTARNSGDNLIDIPKFKALAGISRKFAIPLLEYFDREKVTVRSGDKRMILS